MAIEWQVLGKPDADNALLVTIDSGQSREQILFDCGQSCLDDLSVGTIQSIQNLFFSHFHMDHVSGFDGFFRHNYNRPSGLTQVWGPPGTIQLMSHRFLGFSWNLHGDQPGEWVIREQDGTFLDGAKFVTAEAFETAYPLPRQEMTGGRTLLDESHYRVESLLLPHGSIPSAAYRVIEADKTNIDPAALKDSNLTPGPWLQDLADDALPNDDTITIGGSQETLGSLRERLMTRKPGQSLAFLTDFRILPDTEEWSRAVEWLSGTTVLVSECQYAQRDTALAEKHGHMSADLVGRLAAEARVETLTLQHFSRRYEFKEIYEILEEAKREFPETSLPEGW